MSLPADSPMNDIIGDRSDYQKDLRLQQMRAELDALGYHVIRKDWVRKFGVQKLVSDQDRFNPHWKEISAHIRLDMGRELGAGILRSGAVPISEGNIDRIGFAIRAEVSIILRDPTFDMPAWADPVYRK